MSNNFHFYDTIEETEIQNLYKISLDTHLDNRGEIWTLFKDVDWLPEFVEDKISISTKGVLRGLHGDDSTWKLISCLHGSFLLVVVDARNPSDTYKKIQYFEMTDSKGMLILVPPGCLNAHLSLSDKCIFWYKWSHAYSGPQSQETVAWDDLELNIQWPISDPVLSERDKNGKLFKNINLVGDKNEYKIPVS